MQQKKMFMQRFVSHEQCPGRYGLIESQSAWPKVIAKVHAEMCASETGANGTQMSIVQGVGKKQSASSAKCKSKGLMCNSYNLFPGRPDKARAKSDNNCCKASLDREHIGLLSPDQWIEDKQVKRCVRLEVYKLNGRA